MTLPDSAAINSTVSYENYVKSVLIKSCNLCVKAVRVSDRFKIGQDLVQLLFMELSVCVGRGCRHLRTPVSAPDE